VSEASDGSFYETICYKCVVGSIVPSLRYERPVPIKLGQLIPEDGVRH
jgi:hypothetical protein